MLRKVEYGLITALRVSIVIACIIALAIVINDLRIIISYGFVTNELRGSLACVGLSFGLLSILTCILARATEMYYRYDD